jgi:pimeloyl-ACP methyl ester carboxylesterase
MDRAVFDGLTIEYELHGKGEPIVLIHPGHFADWLTPLLNQAAMSDSFQMLHYHRVGCARSSSVTAPVSMEQHAAHCRMLMQHLGLPSAHIVGHSSSGNVALQLALDSPDVVRSLAILEPALMSVPSAPKSRIFVGTAIERYRSGDRAAAVDTFLRGVCGPSYRAVLDQALPDAFQQHVDDAATFFESELPALQQWSFTRDDAARITQPVLAVIGSESRNLDPIWEERHELLTTWLPNVESFELPGATHLLQVQNPEGMAQALAEFFARH